MDNFLREQSLGQANDIGNEFTIDREKSRATTLESVPMVGLEPCFRLLEAAVTELGYRPDSCISDPTVALDDTHYLLVNLPHLGSEKIAALISELRAPFGSDRSLRRLAQAILIGATNSQLVKLSFKPSGRFRLAPNSLEIPCDLRLSSAHSLVLKIYTITRSYSDYKTRLAHRALQSAYHEVDSVIPLHGINGAATGFFAGRTKSFTAIRSYVYQPESCESLSLRINLERGPFSPLDDSTMVIDPKPTMKFLFFRGKPSYGSPTILHQGIGSPLTFGEKRCCAAFSIGSSEKPAWVRFLSDGIVSNTVTLEGVKGLVGTVVWPGLRFDLWGTQLVRDDNFDTAVAWAQEQAKATADCLAQHLEHVIDRVCNSQLLKANYYADEVAARMRALWGSPPST